MAMINYVPHAYSNLESFSHIQFRLLFFFWILWDFLFVFFMASCLHSYLARVGVFGKSGFIHELFCKNLLLVKSISLLF